MPVNIPEPWLSFLLDVGRKLDLVLAKLARNSPRDRADVEFLVRQGALDRQCLEDRFEEELRPYLLNEDREAAKLKLWIGEYFGE